MERRRRMRWQVNLPDIPEHAQLQPVEHFFPHVIPRRAKSNKKRQKDKTALFRATIHQEKYIFSNCHKSTKRSPSRPKKTKPGYKGQSPTALRSISTTESTNSDLSLAQISLLKVQLLCDQ